MASKIKDLNLKTVAVASDEIPINNVAACNTDCKLRISSIRITGSQVTDLCCSVTCNAAVILNTAKLTNAVHTGCVTGGGALLIINGAVSNAKLADMATARIKGRVTACTGDPEDITAAQVRTMINVECGSTADQTAAQIKTAYEGECCAFTDTLFTKLGGIETLADVTDEANVSATASVIANTAKVTNATHTACVTGSGAITITA